jgi:sugar phosphate isomerase/epimerase
MRTIEPMEIGVMFWAGRDRLPEIKSLGVNCGQLGIHGGINLDGHAADDWRRALEDENFALATVFAAYNGESYADIPTVQRTVGFIPRETRREREERTYAVSDFAAKLGAPSIATHIGFVPEDASDADYAGVRDVVRRVCDHAARHNQFFALETGQEPAAVLLRFFRDVDRPNLRINFDPANMILYGTGDPIEALRTLAEHVLSVHCKDGDWPPAGQPGALGTERPLGSGAVGVERFIATLKDVGYRGILSIEREAENQEERLRDIHAAVNLLKRIRGSALGAA